MKLYFLKKKAGQVIYWGALRKEIFSYCGGWSVKWYNPLTGNLPIINKTKICTCPLSQAQISVSPENVFYRIPVPVQNEDSSGSKAATSFGIAKDGKFFKEQAVRDWESKVFTENPAKLGNLRPPLIWKHSQNIPMISYMVQ